MLKSKAIWNFSNEEAETIAWSGDSTDLSPVIKELLVQRGITTAKDASEFLSPDLANLLMPEDLLGMDVATDRVHKAIKQNEKILVYGDYDADGVTSTTLLMSALLEIGADCDYYIPNRFTEGYGPNEHAFSYAHEQGVKLIITVDCGIASVSEAKFAESIGLDLIITDHHEPQEELPGALAILHPKCAPTYSFKELAGVGVAFKFAQGLLGYFPDHLLDLVAVGTIADLVPLVNENRILAYYGLQKLTDTKRPGLRALKNQCRIEGNVSEEDVGFQIAPRLNAVGRLKDAGLAVELLMTEAEDEAAYLAEAVQDLNKERQQLVNEIVAEAEVLVDDTKDSGVTIVAKEGWNEGVLGIVASKLVKKYDRPAIVLAIHSEKGSAKGSARSIPAFDLFKNCMQVRDYFTHFGGHSQAAGMTLPIENIALLRDTLTEMIYSQLTDEEFKQEITVSKTLSIKEINEELVNEISQLAPFGMANPKPVFHLKQFPSTVRQIGAKLNHLKVQFKQESLSIDGIGFGLGDCFPFISEKNPLSVVGEIGINEWNGNRKAQIVIQDLQIDEQQLFDHRGKKQLDILPFLNNSEHYLAIGNNVQARVKQVPIKLDVLSYTKPPETMDTVDTVFLFDLPDELENLEWIIRKANPINIHVCFYLEDSHYLKAFPSREDFKQFYALILKRGYFDIKKDLFVLMKSQNWTEERIRFMLNVFFELNFVIIENGLAKPNRSAAKKDLQESRLYQQRIKRSEIEKKLYYSNYDDLNQWFHRLTNDVDISKEELTYGI
ncbi:single-stranded-DNA-specific exonuclease RecJ [Virgibacillus phasianinus]|uniref:Single-stranded-DNA-specific exonuclease RecJ n=1 Tax=Virgibacillus phasianinus TaxID=2017483 RepID=A0A220U4R8_9BACI|nr:single-stranded-DNA-specific exonuclease RecJ [Virgibacillus phasianinus]ASK63090.1 single-stranded-DNA-specific exonuclease RecJ [Virgibacillus phasianinus]